LDGTLYLERKRARQDGGEQAQQQHDAGMARNTRRGDVASEDLVDELGANHEDSDDDDDDNDDD